MRATAPLQMNSVKAEQSNPSLGGRLLQRKLTVGASNDPLEKEADEVAERVLAMPQHSAIGSAGPRIQRLSGQPTGQSDTAPASVDKVLASPGRPLEPTLRQDMERRFGFDFSQVRVHSGAVAGQSARDLNATAYTVGHNIAFDVGRYAPETREGRRLIAHELAHVVQQSNWPERTTGDQRNGKRGLSPISVSPISCLNRKPRRQTEKKVNANDSVEGPPIETTGGRIYWQISAPSPPGWVSVRPIYLLLRRGEPPELPHTVEVEELSSDDGEKKVRINQGFYVGKEAYVRTSHLVAARQLNQAVKAKFNIAAGEFWYDGSGPVAAITDSANPTPAGTYDIQIPDFQHSDGAKYGDYGTTWFRIGESGDRYLHPGRHSLGCVTITDTQQWPAIYRHLISSRRDNMSVGKLEVT